MKYEFLIKLLPYLDAFEQEVEKGTIPEFGEWLSRQTEERVQVQGGAEESMLEQLAAYYLGVICKHTSHYTKKAFSKLKLQGMEEYGFLRELEQEGIQSKSALIQACYSSTPSGMEVIKRLIKKGLVVEKPSHEDRRVKLLEVSPKGKVELENAQKDIRSLGHLVTGDLSTRQKEIFSDLLAQLVRFHEQIFLSETEGLSLQELEEKFISS
jgi:DNA-binding MarR family transcriptional regulator